MVNEVNVNFLVISGKLEKSEQKKWKKVENSEKSGNKILRSTTFLIIIKLVHKLIFTTMFLENQISNPICNWLATSTMV